MKFALSFSSSSSVSRGLPGIELVGARQELRLPTVESATVVELLAPIRRYGPGLWPPAKGPVSGAGKPIDRPGLDGDGYKAEPC